MGVLSVLVVLVSAWGIVADSQAGGDTLPCIKKLLPCQPYLKGSTPPLPSCCVPLNQILADDRQCLCAVFNNEAILKSFNVTQDDALKLAKTCRPNTTPPDVSLCGKAAAPAATPPTSTNSSTTSAPPPKKSGSTTAVGRSVGLAALLSLTVLATILDNCYWA